MAFEIHVPQVGESVTEAVIARWFVVEGALVSKDQPLCEIESDKVNLEVPSPATGRLVSILAGAEASVKVGQVIGIVEAVEGEEVLSSAPALSAAPPASSQDAASAQVMEERPLSPAVRRLLTEHPVSPSQLVGTGPGGRILKGDVLQALERSEKAGPASAGPAPAEPARRENRQPEPKGGAASKPVDGPSPSSSGNRPSPPPSSVSPATVATFTPPEVSAGSRSSREEHVKMSLLRRKVAERLVQVQHTAAILTTFNEVDMTRVLEVRSRYGEVFREKHGVKLGFMSFFVKAAVEALKAFPAVNSEIRGDEIVYKRYYDIGVAVGGGKGLVVPVVRDADRLSFAEVEKSIAALAQKAKDGKLSIEELTGGTFTISNGGIYGSLMSTPILNPPQTGILGMHKTQDRPMAVNGQVVIRPMMYLALSYDHRVIDGREAVSFLIRVKDCIENPERILLEV